jgi:hypothetical protein
MDVVGLTAGRLTIGGSAAQRNVFNDEFAGCYFADTSGSTIAISHNRMQASQGENIWFLQGVAAYNSGQGAALLPRPTIAISGSRTSSNMIRKASDFSLRRSH